MATARIPEPASVYCYATGDRVTVAPGMVFDDDDPIVEQCADWFSTEVEDASAAPGRKRTVRKTSAKPAS